jgi:AraC-like DNA-binding protein/predicted transcriptional regulator YdeE
VNTRIGPVIQAINFIEEKLKRDICIADAASASGYSIYHFCRIFNQTVHITPYDYLIRRRISCATSELSSIDKNILSISKIFCFKNPETFSRAFRRVTADLPSSWREKEFNNHRILLQRITHAHLVHYDFCKFFKPMPVEIAGNEYCGLMTRIVGETYQKRKDLKQQVIFHLSNTFDGKDSLYGSIHYQDSASGLESFDFIGCNENSMTEKPKGFVKFQIAAGEYIRFEHRGGLKTLDLSLDFIFGIWLPSSGLPPIQSNIYFELSDTVIDHPHPGRIYLFLPVDS